MQMGHLALAKNHAIVSNQSFPSVSHQHLSHI